MKNQEQQQNYLKLINAITPDWTNRSDYINRVKQTEKVTVFAEDGTAIETEVEFFISWESIKAILGLVQKKADIADDLCVPCEPQSE